jgi:signal transduction histidine kinase
LRGAPIAVLSQNAKLETTWAWVHGRELDAGARSSLALFPPSSAEKFRATASQVLAQRLAHRIELEVRIDGDERCYEFLVEPGPVASEEDSLSAVGYDVTPNKVALRSLRETDKRKDEFLATLSHELRNPLTPLRTALDTVKMETATEDHRNRAYQVMDRELDNLVRLVNELLDLSRITHGKVTLEQQPVDLVRVIEAALDTTRPAIERARHTLEVKLPPGPLLVTGDPGRLAQVVTNLLLNATKYTPDGGRIDVVLERLELDRARLDIRDTGIGIEPALLPRIFDIFVQSRDERSRSRGGLGIGLNLVSMLVALHGGTVKAESDGPGNGARFIVELPPRKDRDAHSHRG